MQHHIQNTNTKHKHKTQNTNRKHKKQAQNTPTQNSKHAKHGHFFWGINAEHTKHIALIFFRKNLKHKTQT